MKALRATNGRGVPARIPAFGIPCLVIAGASLAFLGGCASRKDIAQKVKLSRAEAYRQWQSQEGRENDTRPVVSGKLSLEDSIKLTLGHNKMLEQTLQQKEIARGQQMSLRSAYLPGVDLSGRYARDQEVPSFDIPGPNNTTQHVQIRTTE